MLGRWMRYLHLVTGGAYGKLLDAWSEFQPKSVLTMRTSDDPPLRLTGLCVDASDVLRASTA